MQYKQIQGKADGFEDVYKIRYTVFIEEQGYSAESETEEQDAHCTHLLALDKDTPVATCRLYQDEAGEYHIGRMAVLPQYRGKKVGSEMMRRMIEQARRQGAQSIVLGAQYDKTYFYEQLGFVKTGKEYLDEGYPHSMMRLTL